MEYLQGLQTNGETNRKRLVILPDDISIGNFNYAAAKEGLPLKDLVITTIDGLAEMILDPDHSQDLRIVDRRIVGQLIRKIINGTPDPSLDSLRLLPLDDRDAQESLVGEFDEYLRCVNVDSLAPNLADIATRIDDPFYAKSSVESIKAFASLEKSLTTAVRTLGPSVFLSRVHQVKQATKSLSSSWPEMLNVAEVLVSNIPVFDANALNLLAVIAERGGRLDASFTVRIFQGSGTYPSLRERLTKARLQFREAPPDARLATSKDLLGDYATTHVLNLMALPDRRREVEEAAKAVRELLLSGVNPSDILLLARDSGVYLPYLEEIFPDYGIPFYVQTRRPYAHLSAYRFLKATLELIVAAKSGSIQWDQITDPLRLGFCLPGRGTSWPLGSRQFIYLEESLPRLQRRLKEKLSLADWITAVTSLKWDHPKKLLLQFLDWVERQRDNPPTTAEDARQVLAGLLGTYMFQESVWTAKSVSPHIVRPERFILSGLHPTRFAARIRGALGEFSDHVTDYESTFGRRIDWELVDQAFGEVFGSKTYGLPEQDLASVKLADVGTISFVTTKHAFAFGLKSDEFPRKTPRGTFIPDTLRDEISNPREGDAALLYLRSSISDYENEYDYLESVIQTRADFMTCSMPYLDEDGNNCEWSPFVERVKASSKRRVRPDEWLPVTDLGRWAPLVSNSPPRVRERLYLHHSRRQFPGETPAITEADVNVLASGLDRSKYESEILGRLGRYLNPSLSIRVEAAEPWFAGLSMAEMVGPPFRAHEIDLHGTCPLQFYFFNFLFRWSGKDLDRDAIPPYSKLPNWRYGRLPRRLSYFYVASSTQSKLKKIIDSELANRQDALLAIPSPQNLENRLSGILSEFDLVQLADTFEDEWSLVRQERRDSITRQWNWIDDSRVFEIGSTEKFQIVLPSHRLDDLQNSKLILSYINFSRQIENREGGIFYDKNQRGIERASDPLKDYRIAILLSYYSSIEKVAGAVFVELFDGRRIGYYNQAFLQKHKGPAGYSEELQMNFSNFRESRRQVLSPMEWRDRNTQFQNLLFQRVKMMTPNPDVVYEATPSEEVCSKCVYNDLCQLPRANGL